MQFIYCLLFVVCITSIVFSIVPCVCYFTIRGWHNMNWYFIFLYVFFKFCLRQVSVSDGDFYEVIFYCISKF
jgi:hypothetical protein